MKRKLRVEENTFEIRIKKNQRLTGLEKLKIM